MHNRLLTDIGENYEYLRVIIENNIELKKIQVVEKSSKLISYSILAILLSVFSLLAFIILLGIFGTIIFDLSGSLLIALSSTIAIIAFISIILFLLRSKLTSFLAEKILYQLIS